LIWSFSGFTPHSNTHYHSNFSHRCSLIRNWNSTNSHDRRWKSPIWWINQQQEPVGHPRLVGLDSWTLNRLGNKHTSFFNHLFMHFQNPINLMSLSQTSTINFQVRCSDHGLPKRGDPGIFKWLVDGSGIPDHDKHDVNHRQSIKKSRPKNQIVSRELYHEIQKTDLSEQ
jgi:hypothetical protein